MTGGILMDNPYELRMQFVCGTIEYVLKNKINTLSPTAKINISHFVEEMDNLLKSIESISMDTQTTQNNQSKGFYFSPNLLEVIEVSGFNDSITERNKLSSIKNFIINKKKLASDLLENPTKVYRSEKSSNELRDFVNNISSIYNKEFHVLSHSQSMICELV